MPGAEARLDIDFAEQFRESEFSRRNYALIEELSVPLEGSEPIRFDTLHPQAPHPPHRHPNLIRTICLLPLSLKCAFKAAHVVNSAPHSFLAFGTGRRCSLGYSTCHLMFHWRESDRRMVGRISISPQQLPKGGDDMVGAGQLGAILHAADAQLPDVLEVSAIQRRAVLQLHNHRAAGRVRVLADRQQDVRRSLPPVCTSSHLPVPVRYTSPLSPCITRVVRENLTPQIRVRLLPGSIAAFTFCMLIAELLCKTTAAVPSTLTRPITHVRRTREQDVFNLLGSLYVAVLFIGASASAPCRPLLLLLPVLQCSAALPVLPVLPALHLLPVLQ